MASWISRLFGPDPVYVAGQWGSSTLEERVAALSPWDIPLVVATRQLIADTVATFPLEQFNTDTRQPLDSRSRFTEQPDRSMPYGDFLEHTVNDMTGPNGGAWWMIDSWSDRWGASSVSWIAYQRVTYTLTADQQSIAEIAVDGRTVPVDRMVHVPMILDRGPIGHSPLFQIQAALDNLNRAYVFASDYYGAGATPPYALVHETRRTSAQAENDMQQWLEARAKRRPAVLSGKVSIETFQQQSAADALLLDAINYLDATIARVMQVPPSLVNALSQSSLTYSTVRDEGQRWLTLGLQPGYLARLETAFNQLAPQGVYYRFDTSGLTGMDQQSRLDIAVTAYQQGLWTRDEARQFIDPTMGTTPPALEAVNAVAS